MKRKPRILMVETANMNLGDNVISDNNCRLLRYAMFPRSYELFRYNLISGDEEQIRYADAVIFAAGIIKSTNEKLWYFIPRILEKAQQYNVPVFFSGIGAEPIQADEKGQNLKKTLNYPCVKVISCRDDMHCLQTDYLDGSGAELSEVYDSALWSKQTYRKVLKASKYKKDKNLIGIGIIRHKIFPDYGNEQITKQMQITFWTDVIETLEKKGYRWKIFTNGDTNDELFAKEMLELLGRGEKYPAPRNANALMQYIASFGGVIAGRMHSNIIAYTLGIPSVGLIWNKKLRIWGEKIGYPERFIEPDEMDGVRAAEILCEAMQTRCKPTWKQMLPSLKAFRRFTKYIHPREIEVENVPLKQTLCAMSLGCIENRYKGTNSLQALELSLKGGYENVLADVRLSKEKTPVLVRRWHAATYKALGLDTQEEDFQKPLPLSRLMKARYYNRFKPISLEGFFEKVNAQQQLKHIILSPGCPGNDTFRIILESVQANCKNKAPQLILLLERQSDIAYYRTLHYPYAVMYHYLEKEPLEEALRFCKDEGVEYICFKTEYYNEDVQKKCDASGIKTAVLNTECLEQMIGALKSGARFVGSNCYDVNYLERLLHA